MSETPVEKPETQEKDGGQAEEQEHRAVDDDQALTPGDELNVAADDEAETGTGGEANAGSHELEGTEKGQVDHEALTRGGNTEPDGGQVDDESLTTGGNTELDGGQVDDESLTTGGRVGVGPHDAESREEEGDHEAARGVENAEFGGAEKQEEGGSQSDDEALTIGRGVKLASPSPEAQSAPTALGEALGLEVVREPQCVFCRVVSKEQPAQILFEDANFLCFWDHRPAATHHYLVIPKTHIRDPKALTGEHVPVVERMVEIGKQVLTGQGGNVEAARIGFHWPPVIWVKHLHLHIVSPESSMSWFNRKVMYRQDSFTFVTHTWLIEHLKTLQ